MPFAAKFTLCRSDDKFAYQSLRRSGRRRVLLSLMDEFLLTLNSNMPGFWRYPFKLSVRCISYSCQ